MAVPFLLAALGIERVTGWLRRYSRYVRYVSVATGVRLVIIGVMLLFGIFQRLAAFGFFFNLHGPDDQHTCKPYEHSGSHIARVGAGLGKRGGSLVAAGGKRAGGRSR